MIRSRLTQCGVREIVGAIARAAERWCDRDAHIRVAQRAAVSERTGYAGPVVDRAFDELFHCLTRDAIEATIAGELGSIDALDRFVRHDGVRARAISIGSVCIISSRTTIGVAILPAIFALCAKCDVLVKDCDDRLVGAFFDTLGAELDVFCDAARAEPWDGEKDDHTLGAFDAVVAFGTDRTLERISRSLPLTTRFIPYGSKASAGYIGREALDSSGAAQSIAGGAACDLLLYESQGCLSLHVLFVERGGAVDPERFTALLASAIERERRVFPPGRRSPEMIAALAHARDLALFGDAAEHVYSDARAEYLTVLDPPTAHAPEFLPWMLGVHSVDGPDDAAAYLRRHGVAIEALAIAGSREDIAEMALAAGASRLTSFGRLQCPAAGLRHGGRPRIAEFVRWLTDDR